MDDQPAGTAEVTAHRHGAGAFGDALAVRLVDWRPDFCRLTFDIADWHMNGGGVVHGGVIAALLDIACAHAGVFDAGEGAPRRCLTVSLTTTLIGPARKGRIIVEARRRGGGGTLFMATGEAFTEDGAAIATAEAVCRYTGTGKGRNRGDSPAV
jgi:uncharacterized protein (TIGR00369 family)